MIDATVTITITFRLNTNCLYDCKTSRRKICREGLRKVSADGRITYRERSRQDVPMVYRGYYLKKRILPYFTDSCSHVQIFTFRMRPWVVHTRPATCSRTLRSSRRTRGCKFKRRNHHCQHLPRSRSSIAS